MATSECQKSQNIILNKQIMKQGFEIIMDGQS